VILGDLEILVPKVTLVHKVKLALEAVKETQVPKEILALEAAKET